ncbi:uncharacterized protein TNIN_131051 [Trichonephila inaurata madagascariensis]|uniref:H15 domain-containing protein n=1 Tax=Trichonephila inaurata madagascariensis TaxID=2747483 RepID=A0A8X6XXV1_9ARAC|nr:uncharacterized protein TNIN_131051 [Trichonephila inaurata madagascariensis]
MNHSAFENNKHGYINIMGTNSHKQMDVRSKIRKWILKSVSDSSRRTSVTLYSIKKFLDTKHHGISNTPETKLILKRLVDNGHLIKVDGRFASADPDYRERKEQNQKHNEKRTVLKNNCPLKYDGKQLLTTEKEKTVHKTQ